MFLPVLTSRLWVSRLTVRTVFSCQVQEVHLLYRAATEVTQRRALSRKLLESILGHCTWALLCFRPALSIFSHAFRFVSACYSSPGPLWPSVISELLIFRDIISFFLPPSKLLGVPVFMFLTQALGGEVFSTVTSTSTMLGPWGCLASEVGFMLRGASCAVSRFT
jgi:hypothetical protein